MGHFSTYFNNLGQIRAIKTEFSLLRKVVRLTYAAFQPATESRLEHSRQIILYNDHPH